MDLGSFWAGNNIEMCEVGRKLSIVERVLSQSWAVGTLMSFGLSLAYGLHVLIACEVVTE
jgi:hypothetical protein